MTPRLAEVLARARRARLWLEIVYGAWALAGALALCYLTRPGV